LVAYEPSQFSPHETGRLFDAVSVVEPGPIEVTTSIRRQLLQQQIRDNKHYYSTPKNSPSPKSPTATLPSQRPGTEEPLRSSFFHSHLLTVTTGDEKRSLSWPVVRQPGLPTLPLAHSPSDRLIFVRIFAHCFDLCFLQTPLTCLQAHPYRSLVMNSPQVKYPPC